jgi:hypothetical protein
MRRKFRRFELCADTILPDGDIMCLIWHSDDCRIGRDQGLCEGIAVDGNLGRHRTNDIDTITR